jgi:Ion transport protein.
VAQLTAADVDRLAAAVGVDQTTAREWVETARTYQQQATDGGDGDQSMMNYSEFRLYIYELFAPRLGGRAGAALDWGIMALIIINISAVIIGTVDLVQTNYGTELYLIEVVSVVVFTIEYLARVWSVVETREYPGTVWGRLRFVITPLMIVDLVVLLPFYLTGLFPGRFDARVLRALRLLRVVRLLKIVRYSDSIRSFGAVFHSQKEKLVVAGAMNSILLVMASSVMYQLEHRAQPELFSSIPQTL